MKGTIRFLVLLHVLIGTVECSIEPEEGQCRSDADCTEEECCVGLDRRRFIFSHATTGTCRSLRYQGFSCHVFLSTNPGNSNLHVTYCPCAEGLECRGTSVDKLNASHIIHHDPKCLPKE
ncbi:uncharacterized protein LOC127881915 [Dreissena polymorpha]|uniref:Prokineticin domain-containing protein n=1 Tax=Dreissena polymorpha TaxID=45954 RepID=A0A9D4GRG4_DREPO|nr:uncharacterized protein LOC127881915 [Dreissena polymorpha]KAH3820151.1 hypothetical protein DPMN_121895 [Dreissena polymorpha]